MRPNLIAPRISTVGGASTGAILAASSGPDRLLKSERSPVWAYWPVWLQTPRAAGPTE